MFPTPPHASLFLGGSSSLLPQEHSLPGSMCRGGDLMETLPFALCPGGCGDLVFVDEQGSSYPWAVPATCQASRETPERAPLHGGFSWPSPLSSKPTGLQRASMLSRSSKLMAPSYLCWHRSPAPAHFSFLCCCSVTESPSRARTLEAGKRWARLAQARAASRPGLCATSASRGLGPQQCPECGVLASRV